MPQSPPSQLLVRFGFRAGIAFCIAVFGVCVGLLDGRSAFAEGAASGTELLARPTRAQQLLEAIDDAENPRVLIAAHRGGYSHDVQHAAPENSVANVAVAIEMGYEVFETDIRRTADGVFVIVHDATLERETDGTGAVEEMTFEQVKTLKKRYRDGSLSDEKVATLTELLDAGLNQILFKADLKPGVIDHFDELARLIDEHPAGNQVFLRTVFKDADVIEQSFAQGTPRVEIMFKARKEKHVKKIHKRFSPKTIQIDFSKKELKEPIAQAKLDAIQMALELGMLVETHISEKHPEQTSTLLDAGVRMLHTNKPDETREFVDAYLGEKGLVE